MPNSISGQNRTDWIISQTWTASEVNDLLLRARSGRRTLEFIERHAIPVFKAVNARSEYTHLGNGEKSEWYLYGWTRATESRPEVLINSRMDPFTAAATIVHEVEHAQWYFTGQGGYEEHARVADLMFYIDHRRLDALPEEYFTSTTDRSPIILQGVNGLEVNWLEVITRWGRTSRYSDAGPTYAVEYRFDGLEQIEFQLA